MSTTFEAFLREGIARGGFSTEDVLASFLALGWQVVEGHESGRVAPLEGVSALRVEGVRIWFEEAALLEPRRATARLRTVERAAPASVEVVDVTRREDDDSASPGAERWRHLRIAERGVEIVEPAYLPGYVAWEHEIEHHDPLTDVFSLGLILASLACALDLSDPHDVERFVVNRRNLFRIRQDLHPVLAKAVLRMTELDRARRAQDLPALLRSVESYRSQGVDFELALAQVEGFGERDLAGKKQIVLAKLQERLFEMSRRNRLLHFRATMQSVNLTEASVPLSFDIRNIRPDQIVTWSGSFRKDVLAGSPFALNKYLNFQEAIYLPSVLDRVRTEARRDEAEFGFAQLRLVLGFLRWSNLKESPPERYHSPLILLPARLSKKRGVRDTFILEPLSTVAEVNPVIRHAFNVLYGVQLPETIDLSATDLQAFYEYFSERVLASEPGVNLEKIDRPRIDLIHECARRRLEQYRRRSHVSGRRVLKYEDFEYSYHPDNFHPLGIQLYNERVAPPETRLRAIVAESPRPRSFAAPARKLERTQRQRILYRMRRDDENPYTWEFDLSSVTLGNFKYRKMSLVRDYDELVGACPPNDAFEAVFSLTSPAARSVEAAPPALAERYHVVPCDRTQAGAIAQARGGEHYIIQGPPGTGKSQTIANLIADYVARGKRVLFVCEKRAAIDVVFHRLQQRGLAGGCCLIHDSQADKKEFVHDLRDTYESALGKREPGSNEDPEMERRGLIDALVRELEPLEGFQSAMKGRVEAAGVELQDLLRGTIALRDVTPSLSDLEKERLPAYALWNDARGALEAFGRALADVRPDGVLARHPLRRLARRLAREERPLETIHAGLARSRALLDSIRATLAALELGEVCATADELLAAVRHARRLEFFARGGYLALLEAGTPESRELDASTAAYDERNATLEALAPETRAWRERFSRADTEAALVLARRLESKWFPYLRPSFWRLRRVIERSYNFGVHVVQPTWSQVLETLLHEYDVRATRDEEERRVRARFGIEMQLEEFLAKLRSARRELEGLTGALATIDARTRGSNAPAAAIESLLALDGSSSDLRRALEGFLEDFGAASFAQLDSELEGIDGALDEAPEFFNCLGRLAELPDALVAILRREEWTLPELEGALAASALESLFRAQPALRRFSNKVRRGHLERLDELMNRWESLNAAVVVERVRKRFLERVHRASLPAAQLTDDDKELKKTYSRGRRELEHEFKKTMRYRSIRDLAAEATGLVVRDLKPVWLMSPLSVSDTLPLDPKLFDVVIFDEASQITLEEAVPSIFRARQVIVVGDEMQLPPTSFFATRRSPDDEQLEFEEDGELVQYELDSDSLLTHAARNLSSRLLGWHYRSRSESLISFSNQAFYEGRLNTIPDENLPAQDRAEIVVARPEDAAATAARLLDRAVSFHFVESGVYEKRRNRKEADTIAYLVRELLSREERRTIGIVAFSEAQQGEIDEALERLGRADTEFQTRLEEELEREEDDQFVGLLVKNLENIQGDERDIMILSVCYGYAPDGKMRMNFGPINQSGGEKRLNVAFTRAKHHMAVVSSIRDADITNDYNEGARCLKRYLAYAAAMSRGDLDAATRVLGELSAGRDERREDGTNERDVVREQIAARLAAEGWIVETLVGQSAFRCDLALRRPEDAKHRLGVLIDSRAYYRETDILERDLAKPKLLTIFGWKVTTVLAKDWYEDPEKVLAELRAELG